MAGKGMCPLRTTSTRGCPPPNASGTNQPMSPTAAPTRTPLRLAGQPRTRAKSSRVFSRLRLNATPRTPASSPRPKNTGKATSGGAGADATWNTGSWLVNERVSTSAVTAATNAAPKTAGAKCRWSSSRTNVKPARGALKAAARPAPAAAGTRRKVVPSGAVFPAEAVCCGPGPPRRR